MKDFDRDTVDKKLRHSHEAWLSKYKARAGAKERAEEEWENHELQKAAGANQLNEREFNQREKLRAKLEEPNPHLTLTSTLSVTLGLIPCL